MFVDKCQIVCKNPFIMEIFRLKALKYLKSSERDFLEIDSFFEEQKKLIKFLTYKESYYLYIVTLQVANC